MEIVALIAARNEAAYIARCLEHLHRNGIAFCLIDNESTDATVDIAKRFQGRGLVKIVTVPFPGFYDWIGLLETKSELASTLGADWYIHQDADEILEAADGRQTLHDAIGEVAAAGYNAINFDEFVFVPTDEREGYEDKDYVALMTRYYFFEPHPLRLIRSWSGTYRVDLAQSGGHVASFPGQKIYPKNFVLRHYITLSLAHLRKKYASRIYSEREVKELGWHGWRAEFAKWEIKLPDPNTLKTYKGDGVWDKSDPKTTHQFIMRKDDAIPNLSDLEDQT
jgi:glycosyltransferase involved in cell wall biosynthesis